MEIDIDRLFIEFSIAKLNQLARRIEDCLGRLSEDQIWVRGSETENSVGNLVLHLCGNVRQWVVAGVGGKADTRDRDGEFAARDTADSRELTRRLQSAVSEAVAVIDGLSAGRLCETVRIQAYDNTVLAAVYHVVEHFSQHTGQIIFATKHATGEDLGYYRHLSRKTHGESTP